jgi:citrate synthase
MIKKKQYMMKKPSTNYAQMSHLKISILFFTALYAVTSSYGWTPHNYEEHIGFTKFRIIHNYKSLRSHL